MPSIGKDDFSQLSLDPFFLLDDNISYQFGPALAAVGFRVSTIRQEWPNRNPFIDPVRDEDEIIPFLGSKGKHRAVWVTSDWEAHKAHARMIRAQNISVLWLNEPTGRSLTGLQELQLLSRILPDVNRIVTETTQPIYLRAFFNVRRPRLDQLVGTLFDAKLHWKRIVLS